MPILVLPAWGRDRLGQSPLWAKPALALVALSLIGLTANRPAAAQTTTVYSNNFSSGAGAGWSNASTDTTPGTAAHPADKFLGQFGNQSTTLTLNGLVTHSVVNVSFDLYILRSMDGNGFFGPDTWSLTENGNTLITTNFANFAGNNTQSFGGSNGSGGYLTNGNYAAGTGAAEVNTLGYLYLGTPADSVYHFSFMFNDATSTLNLNFIGGQDQGITDESWGLDNVVVKTSASPTVPEASTTTSLGLLLALGLGGIAIARRRKASASTE